MIEFPKVYCICPTYKRPKLLMNVIKCFEEQTYPIEHRVLRILDDSGDMPNVQSVLESTGKPSWGLKSNKIRAKYLSKKFIELCKTIPNNALIIVFEDDDIYFPDHITRIVDRWKLESENKEELNYSDIQSYRPDGLLKYIYLAAESIYTNYDCNRDIGELRKECGKGRMHATWAFTKELYTLVGGYLDSDRVDIDFELGGRLAAECRAYGIGGDSGVVYYTDDVPTYIYRWASGPYNGSQGGGVSIQPLYDSLNKLKSDKWTIKDIIPKFDDETLKCFKFLADTNDHYAKMLRKYYDRATSSINITADSR